MNAGILTSIATFLASRSRRFRWLVPVLPVAIGAYQFYKRSRARSAGRAMSRQATFIPDPSWSR